MLSRWSGLGRCSILEDSYPGARHLEVEDTGSGHPVLLLHGWPDAANVWRHQVPALAADHSRVLAPDLRGFGGSSRPMTSPTIRDAT